MAAGDAGRPPSLLITADRHNRGEDGRETEEDAAAGIRFFDGAGKPYFGEEELDVSRQFNFGEAGRRPNPGSFADERFMVLQDSLEELRLGKELRLEGDELRLGEKLMLGEELMLSEELRLWAELRFGEKLRLGDELRLGEDLWLSEDLRLG